MAEEGIGGRIVDEDVESSMVFPDMGESLLYIFQITDMTRERFGTIAGCTDSRKS